MLMDNRSSPYNNLPPPSSSSHSQLFPAPPGGTTAAPISTGESHNYAPSGSVITTTYLNNMNLPPGIPMGMHSPHHAPNHPGHHPIRPPPTVSRAFPTAGKIYPPNQPLVFNPTNPNAPPIYPCGICHKEVHDNDQAILCESGCNFWFHRICTGLTEHAYQMLTQEVYAEWVCDKCLATKNIPLVKMKP